MNTTNKQSYKRGKIMWVDISHGTIDAKDSKGHYFTATWTGCKQLYIGDYWYFAKDSSHPDADYRAVKKYRSRSLKNTDWHLYLTDKRGRILFAGDMDDQDAIREVLSDHCSELVAISWANPWLHRDDPVGPWSYAGYSEFDDYAYRDFRPVL